MDMSSNSDMQQFSEKAVLVSDIPGQATSEDIVIYFQSETKSGGGEVKRVVPLEVGRAIVYFVDPRVQQRVLERVEHVLKGSVIKVERCQTCTEERFPSRYMNSDETSIEGSPQLYSMWQTPSPTIVPAMKTDHHDTNPQHFQPEVIKWPPGVAWPPQFNPQQAAWGQPPNFPRNAWGNPQLYPLRFQNVPVGPPVQGHPHGDGVSPPPGFFNLQSQNFSTEVKECEGSNKLPTQVSPTSGIPKILEVTGFGPDQTDDSIGLYFESPHIQGGDVKDVKYDEGSTVAHVQFEDDEVFHRVLSQTDLVLGGHQLKVKQHIPKEFLPKTAVKITGYSKTSTEETFGLFFTNKKRSGGGEFKSLKVNKQNTAVLIDYGSEEVAERVASMPSLKLQGAYLTVTMCSPDEDINEDEDKDDGMIEDTKIVLEVTGFKATTTQETIENYFRNKKRSGGGPLVVVEEVAGREERTFTMICNDKEASVLEKKQKLEGAVLCVSQQTTTPLEITSSSAATSVELVDDAPPKSYTIRVSGLKKQTTVGLLEDYFENRRKTGGGKIDKIDFEESKGIAFITFVDSSAADRVFQKRLQLKLNGANLDIDLVRPPKPKKTFPMDPFKIIISNISADATHDALWNYLENKSGCDVVTINFGVNPDCACVTFDKQPDIQKIEAAFKKRPLEKSTLDVVCVYATDSIQVHDLPENCTEDTLENYFENTRKSNGGPVNDVNFHDKKTAVVTFEDYEVVKNVIDKARHEIEKKIVKVAEYYKMLGIRHPDEDSTQRTSRIPSDIHVGPFDAIIVTFLGAKEYQREAFNKELSTVHGHVAWPASTRDTFVISCSLNTDTPNLSQLVRSWEGDVTKAVTSYVAKHTSKGINILQEIWKDVLSMVGDISEKDLNHALVETSNSKHEIRVTGPNESVEDILTRIKKDASDKEEEYNKKMQEITETITTLKEHEVIFLFRSAFDKRSPKCVIDVNQNRVSFTGIPLDVNKAKSLMYEELRGLTSEKIGSTPAQIHLLSNEECSRYVLSKFEEAKVIAVWVASSKDIELFSTDKNHAKEAAIIITRELQEASVPIAKESQIIFRDVKWQNLKADLLNQYQGCLEVIQNADLTQITIAATSSALANVLEVVKDFIEKYTVYEKQICMHNGKFRFIMEYKKDKIGDVEDSYKSQFVKVQPSKNTPAFDIHGTKNGIALAMRKIQEIQTAVVSKSHIVTEPGMASFFQQTRGISFLDGIEKKDKCTIEIFKSHEVEEVDTTSFVVVQDGLPKLHCQNSKDGKLYKIFVGDMTKHTVDAIVNAANGQLKHVGGLAKAILNQGGQVIQTESDEIIKRRGDLLQGHVASTTSGKLPCKRVVHLVGPVWKDGRSGEENYLFEGIIEALKETEKRRLATVAIPAVGSGVFGFPLDLCTSTIMQATKYYFETNPTSCIREVHFLDNQVTTVEHFENAMTLEIGPGVDDGSGGSTRKTSPVVSTTPAAAASLFTPAAVALPFTLTKPNELKAPSGVVIPMKKGSLADERVDVIVNTCGTNLVLSNGAVSKSLLSKAGPQIQQECKVNRPSGIAYGDIVDTQGYNLQCTHVYHTAAPHKGTDDERILRKIMSSCLAKADQDGHTSIAFPAIGTGNLGYPRDFVARVMYEEIGKFCTLEPASLQEIRVVVYDKDTPTCQAFEAEIKNLSTPGTPASKRHGNRHKKASKRHNPKPQRLFKSQDGGAAAYPAGFDNPTRNTNQTAVVNGVKVEVVQGDITKETTDAIVNPTNRDLDLHLGAVSKAIVKNGGSSIASECNSKGMTKKGYTVTSAGKLRCKRVIHVNVEGFPSKDPIKNCLKAAEDEGMVSLSLPAIGTRVSGFDQTCAETLFEAIKKNTGKLKILKQIRIVLFDQPLVNDYQRVLKNTIGSDASKSLGSRIASSLKGAWGYVVGSTEDNDSSYDSKPETAELHFKLFGDDEANLNKAIREIEQCCKDETKDIVMDGDQDERYEAIRLLDAGQIEDIKKLGQRESVTITVDISDRIHRIRVQGRAENAFLAKGKITDILHQASQRVILKEQAEVLSKHVQWVFIDDQDESTTPYSSEANMKIEQAFMRKQPTVRFFENDCECEINFQKEEEIVVGDPSKPVKVKRIGTGATKIDPPSTWSTMTGDFDVVDVPRGSPEFQKVEQDFQQTQPSQINQIQRIQNLRLWQGYMVHKQFMDKSNPPGTQNERTLYHGTSHDTVDKINMQGFNRSFCGKNAVAFGLGVYFATAANYSASNQYARPNPMTGEKHVYQAKVLSGLYVNGNSNMKVPPAKSTTDPNLLYDSTCDNPAQPSIIVIFQDNQAYPEYLIKFT